MMIAIGLEMSTDTDLAAVAIAGAEGGKYWADLAFYGPAEGAVAVCDDLYMTRDNCGVFCDPMPCAGLLDALRNAGCWLHLMEAVDVAAASYEFKAEVRGRRVQAPEHEALREAMKYAVRRPLAAAFAFERRRVPVDMSSLNAASFALWGLRRNEAGADPSVFVI